MEDNLAVFQYNSIQFVIMKPHVINISAYKQFVIMTKVTVLLI